MTIALLVLSFAPGHHETCWQADDRKKLDHHAHTNGRSGHDPAAPTARPSRTLDDAFKRSGMTPRSDYRRQAAKQKKRGQGVEPSQNGVGWREQSCVHDHRAPPPPTSPHRIGDSV